MSLLRARICPGRAASSPADESEARSRGTRGGAMVASGGDPEDEALDPELIHDLGLYELHDESRDGDPLGACACPRASLPARSRTPSSDARDVSRFFRFHSAVPSGERATARVDRLGVPRSALEEHRSCPETRASVTPCLAVSVTARPPDRTPSTRRTLGSRNASHATRTRAKKTTW